MPDFKINLVHSRLYIFIIIYLFGFLGSSYSQVNNTDSTDIKMSYELGEVTIKPIKKESSSDYISTHTINNYNQQDVAGALQTLSGLNYMAIGSKNEAMVTVRGFDLRQVPVYLDGVPVYTIYDGYVDLSRFTSFDIAGITVKNGNSSVLYGPNTMGGVINLVTRAPDKPFEFDGATGIRISRDGFNAWNTNLNLGGRIGKFYIMGTVSTLNKDYYSLSQKFVPTLQENGGKRDNSYSKDSKLSFKAGFKPNETDDYAISVMSQKASKGVPVYTGMDPNQRPRYWQFPDYNKKGIYFSSRTKLGSQSYLKTRLYYDNYYSDLRSYDDSTYTTQNLRSSFTSIYDDNTFGASLEYQISLNEKHVLQAAGYYKYDQHKEYNVHPTIETPRNMIDFITSIGLEDKYKINEKFDLEAGLSYQYLANIRADDYNAPNDSLYSFPDNSKGGINARLQLEYSINPTQTLQLGAARKVRFATMKNRYSYRYGRSIPNPFLLPESALNFDLNYSGSFRKNLLINASLYYSHLDDVIQQVFGVDPQNSSVYQFQNAGKATFYGFDFNSQYAIYKFLSLGLQYNYIQRKNLTNPDLLFIDVPDHKVNLFLSYENPGKYLVFLNSVYNSQRLSTSTGDYVADPFFILNLKASVNFLKYFSLEGGVHNIFDTNYSYSEGYPSEGRSFLFTLRYHLK